MSAEVEPETAVPEPIRQRRRFWRVLLIIAGLIVVAAAVATIVPVSYYAITPGNALDVRSLIIVPKHAAQSHRGAVLLTDVDLISLRAIDYLYYKLDSDADVVSSESLIGPLSAGAYNEQGVIDMSSARQAASFVALQALGYHVTAAPSAVVIYQPEPGSPNAKTFDVGEIVTAVNGKATPTLQSLAAAIGALKPGATVSIEHHVLGSSTSATSTVVVGEYHEVKNESSEATCVRAGATPAANACPCLGIVIEQLYTTKGEPFPITIDADGIVGPSAGLAFTLGLLEKLDRYDLTGGHKIAATGTMSLNGQVGDVGGVAQKTVAVRDAGATIFFVPPEELAVAKAHAGPHLKVIAVSTLSQAIKALEAAGGRLARP